MAFVDELKIHVTAGRGGDGVVRWRREKFIDRGGPSGGNGGSGGSVFARASRDLSILARYRTVKEFKAERGEDGKSNNKYGKHGQDLEIDFPIGSIIKNLSTGEIFELVSENDKVMVLKGGRGGLGNEHFKSSINVSPTESTPGQTGESADFFVELQLIADVGIIGLPNAGKSSLLKALTRSAAKVGAYPFTTLEPNLGDFYGHILADIPGLIEGASLGKGLGHKFLRHVKRTRILLHCVSLEEEDPVKTYNIVRKELTEYDASFKDKEEIVVLTKSDLFSAEEVERKNILLSAALGKKPEAISLYDEASLKRIGEVLGQSLKKA